MKAMFLDENYIFHIDYYRDIKFQLWYNPALASSNVHHEKVALTNFVHHNGSKKSELCVYPLYVY